MKNLISLLLIISIPLAAQITGVVPTSVNTQSGVTYTILSSDNNKLINLTGASPAVTIPAGGGTFPNGWHAWVTFGGTGSAVLTPASGTIDAGASATISAVAGAGLFLTTDGANWFTMRGTGGSGGGVTGPGSSTDRAIATWNGVGGTALRNTGVLIDASNNVSGAATVSTGDGTITGEYRFYELIANGSNYVSWLGNASRATNLQLTLPPADPAAGQVMTCGAPVANASTCAWLTPAYQLVGVGGSSQTPRNRNNLIAGTNITITPADNAGTNSTDVTIAASGGGSSLGVGWGYDGGTGITTTPTKLCTVDVPASTLGTGGTSGHALQMQFAIVNLGPSPVNFTLNYGSSSYTIASGSSTSNPLFGNVLLANDPGSTTAQTMIMLSQGRTLSAAGGVPSLTYEFVQVINEPNQNSASGTLDFSLKGATVAGTETIRVFMCSIKLL